MYNTKFTTKRYRKRKLHHEIFYRTYDIMVWNENDQTKIVIHQCIMYSYELGENSNTWYLLPGKQSTIADLKKGTRKIPYQQ